MTLLTKLPRATWERALKLACAEVDRARTHCTEECRALTLGTGSAEACKAAGQKYIDALSEAQRVEALPHR